MSADHCLQDDELLQVVQGRMEPERQQRFETHLDRCRTCQQRLDAALGEITVGDSPTTTTPALARVMRQLRQRPPSTVGPVAGNTVSGAVASFSFLQPPLAADSMGRLGKYDILRLIGQGGMGAVFVARDETLGREVAVKVPFVAGPAADEIRERFQREARAIAAVKHDNIVTIYSVEEAAGTPLLVMELIDGLSLADLLRSQRRLDWPELARLAVDVCSALVAAHAQGIIHRDIKPANILREQATGRFKVTDFGLARSTVDPALTASGVLAGTPEFMSPEQVSQQHVEARSDLFSLGVVLYQCCSGVSPFQSETILGSLRRVADDEPQPLNELTDQVPAWFGELVMEMLEKLPADRPDSAETILQTLLARLRDSSGILPLPPTVIADNPWASTPGNRRPVAWYQGRGAFVGSFLAVLVTVAALALWSFNNRTSTGTPKDNHRDDVPVSRGPGLYLENGKQPYPTLAAAAAAAESGQTITVVGEGPFATENIALGEKALSIVAAPGSHPVFLPNENVQAGPFLTASADLRLQGIEVRWSTSGFTMAGVEDFVDTGVISIDGGNLHLENCRIHADPTHCVGIRDGSITLINSHLVTEGESCLGWLPGGNQCTAKNCVFQASRTALVINGRSQLDLDHCSFATSRAIMHHLAPEDFLNVTAIHCRFDVDEVLRLMPKGSRFAESLSIQRRLMMVRRMLQWNDENNVYRKDGEYLCRGTFMDSPAEEVMISTIVQWTNLWRVESPTSLESEFVAASENTTQNSSLARLRVPVDPSAPAGGADLRLVGPEGRGKSD